MSKCDTSSRALSSLPADSHSRISLPHKCSFRSDLHPPHRSTFSDSKGGITRFPRIQLAGRCSRQNLPSLVPRDPVHWLAYYGPHLTHPGIRPGSMTTEQNALKLSRNVTFGRTSRIWSYDMHRTQPLDPIRKGERMSRHGWGQRTRTTHKVPQATRDPAVRQALNASRPVPMRGQGIDGENVDSEELERFMPLQHHPRAMPHEGHASEPLS